MASVKARAAVSHVGKVRSTNQDSGYSGLNLFVVADGMGGHAGGDVASALAIKRIAQADRSFDSPALASAAIDEAILAANHEISEAAIEHPQLTGMGTTVTALYLHDGTVTVSHIGDSRLYLLRGGELSQITTDHTFVQRLVDAGRITEDEARVHPRRSVLMRVLGDVESHPEIDTLTLTTHDGDRWMLCSDGLSGVVPFDEIRTLMSGDDGAKPVANRLVKEALEEGAPDNVTVVVIDIGEPPAPATPPQMVGSAASPVAFESSEEPRHRPLRLSAFRSTVQEAQFEPDSDDFLDELIEEDRRRLRRRRITWLVGVIVIIGLLVGLALTAYRWTQSKYFVGESNGFVTIYKGVQQNIGPISLHEVYEVTDIEVADLTEIGQISVESTLSPSSLDEARQQVARLEKDYIKRTVSP